MSVGGEEVEVGMPLRVATDPEFRGRGIFARLEGTNEERVRELGVRLLLTVPNAASTPIFLERLGWSALPSIRVWARLKLLRSRVRARRVERFDRQVTTRHLSGSGDRVLRDEAWLNWRFADAPRPYALLEADGYAAVGRRGRVDVVAAVAGDLLGDATAAADRRVLVAAPPPSETRRYALAGFVPTPRTLTVLGRSLGRAIPARPQFELGDLDFL
jgi:hypothetical protein